MSHDKKRLHSYTTQLAPHDVDEQHPDDEKNLQENLLRIALVHPSTGFSATSNHIPEELNDETFRYECVEADGEHVVFELSMDMEHEEEITSYLRIHRSDIAWHFQGHGMYEAAFHLMRDDEEDGWANYTLVLEMDAPDEHANEAESGWDAWKRRHHLLRRRR